MTIGGWPQGSRIVCNNCGCATEMPVAAPSFAGAGGPMFGAMPGPMAGPGWGMPMSLGAMPTGFGGMMGPAPWGSWAGSWGGMAPGFAGWAAPPQAWAYTGGVLSDEEIAAMIQRNIEEDPIVPPDAEINIEVTGGVVTLTGTVPNKRIKHAVGDDAWWVPGVIDVNNLIEVRPRRERAAEQPQREAAERQQTARPRERAQTTAGQRG